MRGRDEDSGEFRSPSRSQNRREALDVLALGTRLVALTEPQLARLPIPEGLLGHVHDAQRITSHIAHKRQLAFLAKQLRREDDETLDAIRDALDAGGEAGRREVAQMHRVEQWRDRLIADADAMTEFVAAYPDIDAQQLRTLVRNAAEEKKRNKPPRAYREIYKLVREAVVGGAEQDGIDESDDA